MSATRLNLRREPLTVLLLLGLFLSLGLFVVYPVGWVVAKSLQTPDGGLTFQHFLALFSRRHFLEPILNSLLLGVLTAGAGTLLGFLLAFALTRVSFPGRAALQKLFTLPLIAPPFVMALAAILLLGRNGVLTKRLLEEGLGLDLYALGFDVYGLGGLWAVETLSYFPTAFLLLLGGLGAMNPSLEEAAQSLGASRWQSFFRVTLPMAAPGLFSSFLLLFIESLADFGNPLILGGRFHVLSVQAYLQIVGTDDLAGGSALALLLLVPSLGVQWLQTKVLSKRSFVSISGKAARRNEAPLSAGARRFLGAVVLGTAGVIAVFYALLLYGSCVKLWGVDESLSLSTYRQVLASAWPDIRDTLILGGLSAPLSAVLAFLCAYFIERKRFMGRALLEVVALMTFALPGTVVGIGYALAFSHPPVVLSGTATLLVTLLAFRNLPVGLKAASASLKQLDVSLEQAAQNLGASPSRVLTRIVAPLLAPSLFASLAFSFVRAVTAVSAVIFVVSANWNLLTVSILGYVESSDLSQAAALSVILVALVLVVFEGISFMLRRLFPHRLADV